MDIQFTLQFITYVFLISAQVIQAKFDSNKFERKIIALTKVLKYMMERPEQMNIDTAFGVTFTEANLRAALQNKNVIFLDTYQKATLENTLNFSEDTLRTILANEKPYNKDVEEMSFKINQPEIWIKPIIWQKLNLENRPLPNLGLTIEEMAHSMFAGHPQESESNRCLINLVRNCHLLDECQYFIVHDNNSTGYPLTHKLLIMQVMANFQCETSITKFYSYLSFKLCSSILQDLINIEALGFPFVGKDLASEQVLLCGMEGYLDFLDDHYEQLILDWQHPSGCYSGIRYNGKSDWRGTRVRRAGSFTDFGCVNHATGLGAAALALFIRKDIEMLMES